MVARAGRLRERVTIQERSDTTDAQGGVTTSWAAIGTNPTVYASVTPLTGRERVIAAQTDSQATHRVVMRHRDDVTAEHRLLWGARLLYPTGPWINEDARDVLIAADCREERDA